MSVILVLIPEWETCSLVLDVPPGTTAVTTAKGKIETATLAAQRRGISRGMKLTYAQYLCPELLVMPVDETREQRAFNLVMEALETVTPFAQVIRPGLALIPYKQQLNLSPPEEPFKEKEPANLTATAPAQLLTQIVDSIALYAQAEAYVATGQTCLEAWVKLKNYLPQTAHYPNVETFPLLELTDFFPKNAQEIAKMLEELTYLGIETLIDLQTLGWDTLQTRFGLAAYQLKQLVVNSSIKTTSSQTPQPLSIEMEFPTLLQDPLLVVGQMLTQAQQLIAQMQEKQVSAQGINIQAQLYIPQETTDSICRNHIENQLIHTERNWALFTLPTATDITTRIQWQLQVWLQYYQNQVALQLTDQNYNYSSFCAENFGIKHLKITATGIIPIGETIQKLWGNKTASDLRAIRAAEKLQQKLGDQHTQQIVITPGWDPLSRVKYRAFAEKLPQLAWENWQPNSKWRAHPNYQPNQTWQGSFNLPAPSTVFQPPLAVQLYSSSNQPIEVTETGLLTDLPAWLYLEQATCDYLQQQRLNLVANLPVKNFLGPWVQLGRWWENRGQSGKAWLKITVETTWGTSLKKPRILAETSIWEAADQPGWEVADTPDNLPKIQLLVVFARHRWWLAGIW